VSFKCQKCGLPQPAGIGPTVIVVETRARIYPERLRKDKTVLDRGGEGREIVRELSVCKSCAARMK
jgi:hypothetical protein